MSLPEALTEPAHAVAALLLERKQTVAVAESSAGGLISAALLSVPGASGFYLGGTVVYTRVAGRELISGVIDFPEGARSSSDPYARYLAEAIATKLGASWGIAETGAAGPRGNGYGDPAGHSWTAVWGPGPLVDSDRVLTGSDDRASNMIEFGATALRLLARRLGG